MKILLIRLSSIGDILLTSPFPELLKKQHPHAEVHFLVKKQYSGLLRNNPYIDRILEYGDAPDQVREEISKQGYTHVADMQANFRSYQVTRGLGVPVMRLQKENFKKWLLTRFKWKQIQIPHITTRYAQTLKGILNEEEIYDSKYYLKSGDSYLLDEWVRFQPMITWAIGSKQKTKIFPADKIVEVIHQLNGVHIVLLGGEEDRETADWICQKTGPNTQNACGKLKFDESVYVLSQSALLITNDTGLMHAATALNKKMLVIWGSTSPLLGMAPRGHSVNATHVLSDQLSCQPCSRIGFDGCPEGHFRCMKEISAEHLVRKIQQELNWTKA